MSDEKPELIAVASLAMMQADVTSAVLLCQQIAYAAGIERIEGLDLPEWFRKERLRQLYKVMSQLEDSDPGMAALLQQRIDDISGGRNG